MAYPPRVARSTVVAPRRTGHDLVRRFAPKTSMMLPSAALLREASISVRFFYVTHFSVDTRLFFPRWERASLACMVQEGNLRRSKEQDPRNRPTANVGQVSGSLHEANTFAAIAIRY